ncbi:MAG: HAD family hydrolase [Syntrophobacteraceae bacterium]
MRRRAVLFDLDGTLLDTLNDIADSMNSVLKHFGFPSHDFKAYKYFAGDGMEKLVCRALPEADRTNRSTVLMCLDAMKKEYGRRWKDSTRPYEGIPELLNSLAARKVKLAILTNKPDAFAKSITAELLPHWRFEAVVGETPSVKRKPDPATALEIAKQMLVSPKDFLYLGDTATDMLTAGAAGMFPVGALWGFRMADELMAAGAKALVEYPTDLLDLI